MADHHSLSLERMATNKTTAPQKSHSTRQHEEFIQMRSTPLPYAGRVGGNQEFVLDPSDPENQPLLEQHPDAAPYILLRVLLSLKGFQEASLWKQALIEGIGTMMLCYISMVLGVSPAFNIQPQPAPSTPSGIFGTASFIGPTVGAITNIITTSLFIFSFNVVTGGHLNATITIATFLCRMTTLPRMILYVGFQAAGAVIAGLLVRSTVNGTDWKVGGCFFDPNLVETRQMFTAEFTTSLTVLFLAFGLGLDPRQASTFGPALAPILVGLAVGLCGYSTAFAVPGYGGAGMNPDRCLAAWIGSGHSLGVTGANEALGYTSANGDRLWVYWIGPIAAGMAHAVFYQLVPPWSVSGVGKLEIKKVEKSVSADDTRV